MPETKKADMERLKKRVLAEYQGGKKPKELSAQFGINLNTIKSWIKRSSRPAKEGAKKGAEGAPPKSETAPSKGGAPKGNKNAVGNSGGPGGPLGNQKNFRHGAYERVMGELLEADEAEIFNDEGTGTEIEAELRRTLAGLNAKEVRLMKHINDVRNAAEKSKSNMVTISASRSVTKREAGAFRVDENGQWGKKITPALDEAENVATGERESTTTSHTVHVLDALGKLEAELDRVQGRKIKVLGDLERIRIERERLELERKRLDGQTEQSKIAKAWIAALTGEDIEDEEDEEQDSD